MMEVSAVIPTRGDVDLTRIRASLALPEIREIIVKQSSGVWGRYAGIKEAACPIIYTQDDDCVTDVAAVLEAYKPGLIVNAMTPRHAKKYPGTITLIGFGSVFDRGLIEVLDGFRRDYVFKRECDRVFTALVPHEAIFPDIEILPCAEAENRLYKQVNHRAMLEEILRRINEYQSTGRR